MHIIVDGYNLIRQSIALRHAERQGLEAGRNALLHLLNPYQRHKGHKITVVFDGWEGGSPVEEHDRFGAMDIIYSSLGEKADEVIKRMLARRDDEFVVVSSDREIISFATHRNYGAISSLDFEQKLYEVSLTTPQEIIGVPEDDDGDIGNRISTKKKGAAHKLSRAKRREKQVLEKL